MIVATDYVRDVHVEVVYDDPEVVGGNAVGTKEHQIIELRVRHGNRAFDDVVKNNVAFVRVAKANDRSPVPRRHEPCGFRALRTPAPVVAGLLTAGALALAHRIELFLGRPAMVSLSPRDEFFRDLPVARKPLHLKERAFVPVEPEPAHRVEDRLHRSFGRALEIGILDAQDEFAAVLSGVRPGEERGPRPADMEVAGRAWGKTGSDHRRVSNRGIVRDGITQGGAGSGLLRFAARAVSSAVEHSPHTGGATGSIPVPPTTSLQLLRENEKSPSDWMGLFRFRRLALTYFRAVFLALSSALPRFSV